ncbi:hypothetical protein [Neptunomonas sp.]|uniref:hypothetical protein n=1 Tax=Neptunomonas TaxID=75687 RepID=UPI003510E6AE
MDSLKKFEAEFAIFEIPTKTFEDYKGPEELASNFKRCTVLQDNNITYTSNSYENEKFSSSALNFYTY